MDNPGINFNPVTKTKLYRVIRNSVFTQMDHNKVIPERADEILANVKKTLGSIKDEKAMQQFIDHLDETFPELQKVKNAFQYETEEKIDKVVVLLMDEFLQKNEYDVATEIMEQIEHSEDHEKTALALKEKYSDDFENALRKVK